MLSKNVALLIVTLGLAIQRFRIVPRLNLPTAEGSYEAIAHLFVGGLIGAAFATSVKASRWWYWSLAIGISLVELVCFIVQKAECLKS